MLTKLLKSKIHRAIVTQTDVNYHGSITIDTDLLKSSGLLVNEAVIVADCENGNRFETYIIPGKAGSGVIGVNGAAARLTQVGHRVVHQGHQPADHLQGAPMETLPAGQAPASFYISGLERFPIIRRLGPRPDTI